MQTRRDLIRLAGAALLAPASAALAPGKALGQSPGGASSPTAADLLQDEDIPVLGNPEGDVSVVEFFDYQCPYCKMVHPALTDVVASDGSVRLLMRDWPIFGQPSVHASTRVLALSDEPQRYEAALDALMASDGRLSTEAIDRALAGAGFDQGKLRERYERNSGRIDAVLARNRRFAEGLRLPGTPAFIIGRYIYRGALDRNALLRAIDEARA